MKTLIILLLLCGTAYAGQRELDSELDRASKRGTVLTIDDQANLLVRGYRDRREGEFDPPVSNVSRPSDYSSGIDRGTIEFHQKWKNYSMHKVKIPDGTVLDGNVLGGCNFTQVEPITDAIDRSTGFGKNLTFRNCNLTNLKTYPDWVIESSNTAQVDMFGVNTADEFNVQEVSFVASSPAGVPTSRTKPTSKTDKVDGRDVVFQRMVR